jgi:acetyl esterase
MFMSHSPHPDMLPILEEIRAVPPLDYANIDVPRARVMFEASAAAWNTPMPPMDSEDLVLGGVPCRVLRPATAGTVVLFAHGGGWTFGSPTSHERTGRLIAEAAGVQVVMVDYRMAPEHACPAALEDMRAVADCFPGRPIVLLGDSAGANIALGAALMGVRADLLTLIYGCFAPVFDTASHRACGDGSFGLSTERMRWFWNNWQGEQAHPLAAPLQADLAGLPPIHMIAAGLDCLRDDSILLAGRLAQAGVPYRLDNVPGVTHGFLQMSSRLAPARDAIASIAAEIRRLG